MTKFHFYDERSGDLVVVELNERFVVSSITRAVSALGAAPVIYSSLDEAPQLIRSAVENEIAARYFV